MGVLMLVGQGQLGGTTGTRYSLFVIGEDGYIVRSLTAGIQSAGWHLPRFSVAGHSVYFLDGDRDLKALRADGSVAVIGQLPGGPTDRVVFAISPDEQQIAYSVLHYASGGAISTSLRVGALATLNVHEIFQGSLIEFPIGWHAGQLVIVVTRFGVIQNPGEVNPYFADAYHIADAATARRTFSTSPTCDDPSSLQGPANGFGTACQQTSGNNQIILALGWNGTSQELFHAVVDGNANAVPPVVLSPDGKRAAAGIASNHQIKLLSGGTAVPTAASGTPAGWFDANHLLFMPAPCCQPLTTAAVLNVSTNTVTPVAAGLTGEADPYAPFFVPIPNSLV
jgi:hypothetical protein